MTGFRSILLVLACLFFSLGVRAQGVTFSGTVTERNGGSPVGFATVVVEATEQWAVADAKGRFVLRNITVGESVVKVECLGYVTWSKEVKFGKDVSNLRVELVPDNLSLESAVVTAQENGNSATTTRTIDRMALDHVQLMNVSDISSLLPGGATVDPSLTSEKQFNIRAGSGEKGSASFGTAVEVDGVRLSNNASFVAASEFDTKPVKGVSTNNIASSNIESVEVITGVPSVEYGDMGSGIVKVNLKKGKTPWMLTLSTSPSTKQASVSKGFDLGAGRNGHARGIVNASMEYAASISRQMSPYTAYRREQLSLSYTNTLSSGLFATTPLRVTVGVTGNLGGMDTTSDPDAVQGTWSVDRDRALQGHFDLNWLLSKPWITSLELSGSASYSDKESQERTFNSSSINKTVLHGREEGYNMAVPYTDGSEPVMYIPAGYWYNTMCDDDRPLATKLSFKANHSHLFGKVNNKIKLGADWTTDRNFGIGANSPEMATAPTFREYRYCDVPTMHNVGVYLEDNVMIPVGAGHINLIAGLRNDNTIIRGSAYGTTSSLSPRFNAKYTVFKREGRERKAFRELSFRASWGEAVKLPSFAVLFPMPTYRDVRVFASTTNSANESFEAYYTQPRTVEYNPNLKWQRNRMMELGVEADILGTKISLAAYYNRTFDAYRVSTRYDRTTYAYTMDNALANVPIAADNRAFTIDGGNGIVTVSDKTGALPSQTLAYQTYKELSPSYYPDNELNPIDRYGIEWVIEFARIKAIQTDVRIDGNWYAYKSLGTNPVEYSPTTYRTSKDRLPYPYIGLYYGDNAYSNGSESRSLRMNLTLTTHIPSVRMIVTMKLESSLVKYSRALSETPDGKELAKVISNLSDALSVTGESIYAGDNYVVRYPEQYCSYDDPTPRDYLADLQAAKAAGDLNLYNDLLQLSYKSSYMYVFQKDYYSPFFSANFSVTKEIGDLASISFYANNFFVNRAQIWSTKTRTYSSAANYIPKFYYGLTLRLKF